MFNLAIALHEMVATRARFLIGPNRGGADESAKTRQDYQSDDSHSLNGSKKFVLSERSRQRNVFLPGDRVTRGNVLLRLDPFRRINFHNPASPVGDRLVGLNGRHGLDGPTQ